MSKTKVKAMTNSISINTNIQKTLFKFLIGSLLILSVVYIYMIGSITFNVVARKSLETEVKTLGSNISQLELTYINDMNNINKDRANNLGFVDTKPNIFAVRSINHVAIR